MQRLYESSHVKLLIIAFLCLVGQNLLLHCIVMKMWYVILCRNTHVESSYIIDEGGGMCMPFYYLLLGFCSGLKLQVISAQSELI